MKPNLRPFPGPSSELPTRLVEWATRLFDGARASVAAIADQPLRRLERLGADIWRKISAVWPGAAGSRAEPGFAAADVDAWITRLANAARWEERTSAARALALVYSAPVVPALADALRDQSVEVAVAAVDALRLRAEPAATAALEGALENADGFFHPIVRAAAVTALARTLPPTELDRVIDAVSDLDADVSVAAVTAIGEHAPPSALQHLLPVLSDGSGYYLPVTRLAAAHALERSGALDAELARELLQSEQDPAVAAILERAAR